MCLVGMWQRLFFLTKKCLLRHKGVDKMGCIARIHHPNLTKEKKKIREEQIKKALIEFYKSTTKENKNVN